MRGKRPKDKSHLSLRQGILGRALQDAQRSLLHRVFDAQDIEGDGQQHWRIFATFESSGLCVASLEARRLPLIVAGDPFFVTGLRRVAVDPDWRGLGLFRDLMAPALRWCEARTPHPTLLYAEETALYARFGFVAVPQHAFVGAAPTPTPGSPARRLDPGLAEDAALIMRLLATRTPVSQQCALAGAPDLVLRNVLAADDFVAAYAADLAAVIVYEIEGEEFVLVDVIAAHIPSMKDILGALVLAPRRIKALFPPDRLAWSGDPRPDDTGLMARGSLPPAMSRPFMLPPTAEF